MREQRNRHRSHFIKEVKERWPELIDEINEEDGLLHLEVSVLTRLAQRKIDGGEEASLVQIFKLAEHYVRTGNGALENAIGLSFIKKLLFRDSKKNYRSWAWKSLPTPLKKVYIEFHGRPDV